MKKNQGISLISLIITIIVIIVLAAIVIFNGFGTLGRAQLADFSSQVASLKDAVDNKYSNLFTDYALSGDSRTNEQIYFQVATGVDATEGKYMNGYNKKVNDGKEPVGGKQYQNFIDNDEATSEKEKKVGSRLGMSLAHVRNNDVGWCVTENGQVFNASGFYDEASNRTYFTANLYWGEQLPSSKDTTENGVLAKRADVIAKAIINGIVGDLKTAGNEYKIENN